MQHPLVNPSLAPCGFVFPASKERLEYSPPNCALWWVNNEVLISRLWEEINRANAPKSPPLITIIHKILPSEVTANKLEEGDFEFAGLPFLSRDIALVSTLVQWFATSVGNAFIESVISHGAKQRHDHEFVRKFNDYEKQYNLIAHLMHTCTPQCHKGLLLMRGNGHDYSQNEVTARDKAVAMGLMIWLGRAAGRAFIAEYLEQERAAWHKAYKPVAEAYAKAT